MRSGLIRSYPPISPDPPEAKGAPVNESGFTGRVSVRPFFRL